MSDARQENRLTIRYARQRAGLSQVQAAVALGVSEPTYRKYEQDPGAMSLRMAHRLASVLGVDFTDLALYNRDDPGAAG